MTDFLKDISEQPTALSHLLEHASEIKARSSTCSHESVLFLGMGASYYAGLYATLYLRSRGFRAECHELSEFLWYDAEAVIEHYDRIILISQSGKTAELVRFFEQFRSKLDRCFLVTNNIDSPTAAEMPEENVFPIFAGHERAMGSSKSFLNTITALLLIASSWTKEKLDFNAVVDHVSAALKTDTRQFTAEMNIKDDVVLAGRGYCLPILRMAQLTLAEIAKKNVSWYSGAGFRHGAMELLVSSPMVTFVIVQGRTLELMLRLREDAMQFTESVWAITNADLHSGGRRVTLKKGLPEELSALPAMVIFQLISNQLALDNGYVPGHGEIASKVTTKE